MPGQPLAADYERILGTDHPRTLSSRNDLEGAYQVAGQPPEAIALQRILGTDHPDTLNSRNNLAYAYQSAGDLAKAIPLYHRTRSPPASGCSAKSIQSAGPFGSI
jgi:tetratricopeptide (TPR) repeat protein